MNEREFLQHQIEWLRHSIDKYRASNLPPSWIADSIKRTEAQIADDEWRLSFDPPHPAPICGWRKPFRDHPWPCNDTRCSKQLGMKSALVLKRLLKVVDGDDLSE